MNVTAIFSIYGYATDRPNAERKKSVLGACLGSQLLATILGASVTHGAQKEIGWYPTELNTATSDNLLMADMERSFVGGPLAWGHLGTARKRHRAGFVGAAYQIFVRGLSARGISYGSPRGSLST